MNYSFPKRLCLLDISRGIASLSVVLWHWKHFAYSGYTLSPGFIEQNQPFYPILKLFYQNGYLGVEYFFLLSGFIFFWQYRDEIQNKKISSFSFFINRFSRLYPLHFFTLITVGLLQLIYFSQKSHFFIYPYNDVYHFILQLFLASHWGFQKGWSFNSPVWSVSLEVLLYILFFILAYLKKGNIFVSSFVLISSFLILLLTNYVLFSAIYLFFLGGVIYDLFYTHLDKILRLKNLILIITIFLWIVSISDIYFIKLDFTGFIGPRLSRIISVLFPIIMLFPFTLCSIILTEIGYKVTLRKLGWIGDITYSTYLLHFPLQLVFAIMVNKKIIEIDFYQNALYLFLFYLILIPVSYLTFRKFERLLQRVIREFYTKN